MLSGPGSEVCSSARTIARDAGLILTGIFVYFGVRGETAVTPELARDHARDVLALEKELGLDIEAGVQALLVDVEPLTTAANWVYIWGHWPAIAVTLLWLALSHRTIFLRMRNAMIARGHGAVRLHHLPGGSPAPSRGRLRRHHHRAVPVLPRPAAARLRQPVRRDAEPARRLGPGARHVRRGRRRDRPGAHARPADAGGHGRGDRADRQPLRPRRPGRGGLRAGGLDGGALGGAAPRGACRVSRPCRARAPSGEARPDTSSSAGPPAATPAPVVLPAPRSGEGRYADPSAGPPGAAAVDRRCPPRR
jgi:hypothetical protein